MLILSGPVELLSCLMASWTWCGEVLKSIISFVLHVQYFVGELFVECVCYVSRCILCYVSRCIMYYVSRCIMCYVSRCILCFVSRCIMCYMSRYIMCYVSRCMMCYMSRYIMCYVSRCIMCYVSRCIMCYVSRCGFVFPCFVLGYLVFLFFVKNEFRKYRYESRVLITFTVK